MSIVVPAATDSHGLQKELSLRVNSSYACSAVAAARLLPDQESMNLVA